MDTKNTMNLKRDNWTTEEVMKILKGCKICDGEGKATSKFCVDHNAAIDDAIDAFFDFTRPLDEMGAMAYCPEEDMIYHVGAIPDREPISPTEPECRVRLRSVVQSSSSDTSVLVVGG